MQFLLSLYARFCKSGFGNLDQTLANDNITGSYPPHSILSGSFETNM